MNRSISRAALARLVAAEAVLVVEALGADFFADGHLPGAVSVPLSSPDSVVRATVGSPLRPVVVYGSRCGAEAAELAQRIRALGVDDVMIYQGGKEDWAEAGSPIERGSPGSA